MPYQDPFALPGDSAPSLPPNPNSSSSSTITLPVEHLDAAATTLNQLTTQAGQNPAGHGTAQLHTAANAERSDSLFRSVFPYTSVEEFEAEWHLGNYIMDRATGAKTFEPMSLYVRLGMHLLYYGSPQQQALHTHRAQALLREQSLKMGQEYNAPASRAHIQPFIDSFGLQETLKEMVEPDPTKYQTFNAFFARQIRDSTRPQASPGDPSVVTSPADCRLTCFPSIDLATRFWIKGFGFTLPRLVNSTPLAEKFVGGNIVIARLAPQDYHRWHSPVSGTVESVTEIPGTYYTVNPQAVCQAGTLDVFCENRRSVMVIRRSGSGTLVVVVAAGAMLVGSIKYNPGVAVGAAVKRGQCLGAFYYGGSTVIVLYPKGEVVLDADLVRNSCESRCETLVKVGWRVGAGPAGTSGAN
ncbi:hypothetical protein LTR53_010848 [Teratosphaeriaceae sp. CCFEE 6253]|nr:hypothetical protein LTR53_010848 [Teratosphaeriaceae sp. CCFEE 6253]